MMEKLELLRHSLAERLSRVRYLHTLGVEAAAERLGAILLPQKIYELRAAALLHDIAKELDINDQLKLIDDCGIILSDEDRDTISALHAFAAVPVIKKDYQSFATPEILSAVYKHTLGSNDMSVFDKIIYISDYIEDGRIYNSCQRVREYLNTELKEAEKYEDRIKILNRAIVMSIDYTIANLLENGRTVNHTTINTKEALLTLI